MEVSHELVEVAGVRLWTATSGRGAPLLLAHGGPGLWDNLAPVAESLDDLARVHRYDQRGSARSPAPPPYRIDDFLADMEGLRARWDHSKWLVGGHSWGSFLALLYGLRFPDRVGGLVLLNGFGITARDQEDYQRERARRLGAAGQRRMDQLTDQIESRKSGWESAYREFCRLVWPIDFADRARGIAYSEAMLASGHVPNPDVNEALGLELLSVWPSWEDRVADLTVPVLIVQGQADPRPQRSAERLAQILPHAEYVVFQHSGHFPWLEEPAAFSALLRSFVDRVGQAVRPTGPK